MRDPQLLVREISSNTNICILLQITIKTFWLSPHKILQMKCVPVIGLSNSKFELHAKLLTILQIFSFLLLMLFHFYCATVVLYFVCLYQFPLKNLIKSFGSFSPHVCWWDVSAPAVGGNGE